MLSKIIQFNEWENERTIKLMLRCTLCFIVLTFFVNSIVFASPSMLCDFETGVNTSGAEGGGTGYIPHRSNTKIPLPVVSPGAAGTNFCIVYHSLADEEKPQAFYIDNVNSRTLIEEVHGANRMSAMIKLPLGYEYGHDRNFHFGTYTRDPEILSNSQGSHYYHYFNIPGSLYWTKIIANEHPCHNSGSKDEISDNPTLSRGWNYYDGFTRFYFHCKEYGSKPEGKWDWYIDEVRFYRESEPENTVSINAVSCSYLGKGHFQINWHGEFVVVNDHHYEVRYSTFPITNANYLSADIASGCSKLSRVRDSYSWVKADFTINVQDNTRYYFAIKDLDSNIPYVTKIDYLVPGESRGDIEPPDDVANFTATPGVNQISLRWTNPTDNDFAGVMIRYSTDGTYPSTITDGTEVPNDNDGRIPGAPGTSGSYLHTGLEDGTTYYYSAFSYDNSGNYSNTAHTFATPQSGGNHVPVISDFTVIPSTVTSGDPVTFNVVATDQDGDDLTYTINFGDGTSNGHGSEVVHSYASVGTYTAQATVNDGQGGSATQSVQVVVNQQNSGEHFYGYYELEDGTINSPFSIGADENASSGHYVFVQEGTDPSSNPQTNVTMDVTIPYESDYYMWVCMYGPSSSSDALYIGLDGTFDRVYPSAVGEYEYVRVETVHGTGNYTFHLNAGTHVINVGCGEPLARADLILITSDSAFVPSQGSTPPPVNVSPTINNFTATPSSLNNPGETITLNVSATDPNGDSLTYTINFGDGTANGSGSQVEHTYETEGIYTAEVTVDDGNGHIVGKSLQIAVNDVPPAKPTGVTVN